MNEAARKSAAQPEPKPIFSAPALVGACGLAVGVALSAHVWHPVGMLLAATLLCAGFTLVALRYAPRAGWAGAAAVWVCVGMLCAELQPMPQLQRELLRYADGLSRHVTGTVVRSGRLLSLPHGDINTEMESADIRVDAIEDVQPDVARMVPVEGGVRMSVFDPNGERRRGGRPEVDFKPSTWDRSETESVAGDGSLPELRCGDRVDAPMQLREPPRFEDPGVWDYPAYLLSQGVGAHASLAAGRVTVMHAGRATLGCRIQATQQWASRRMDEYAASRANRALPGALRLSRTDAGMLNAMLFGDRSRLDHGLRTAFERTGSFHLFVVSGLHLGIVAGVIFFVLRRMRAPLATNAVLTVALCAGYALLTGWGVPVQRALTMTAVFLAARVLWRQSSVLNALGVAALAVLMLEPHSLFDASFQMTFLALLAIGGLALPIMEHAVRPTLRAADQIAREELDSAMEPRQQQIRVELRMMGEHWAMWMGERTRRWPAALLRAMMRLVELALVGLSIEAVMTLPMALYFHRATVMAIPANVLCVPLIALLLPAAMFTFLASLVSPALAVLPASATALMLHGTTWFVTHVGQLPTADTRIPPPYAWVMVAAGVLMLAAMWAVRRTAKIRAWAAVAAVVAATALTLWPWRAQVTPARLEVTTMDVGQGDSLFVVSPDGHTLLVDAGGPVGGPFAQTAVDIGDEVVSPYLWWRHVRRLDAIALTHAHSDHIGGMSSALRNLRPRELWVGSNPMTPVYRALLDEAAALGVRVRRFKAGDEFVFGGVDVRVLAPEASYVPGPIAVNNDSLVLELAYGRGTALLEGDAEAPSEQAMLAAGRVQPAVLLKVGHHGSRSSSIPEFLAAVRPAEAAISCGRHNPFGHPRMEVVDEFDAARVKLYRTDEMGAATFLLDERGGITATSYQAMPR